MRYDGRWTIGNLIEDRADRMPDRVAVESPSGALTYGQLVDRARRVASGLRDLAVMPDDRVATMLPTGLDYLAAWLGITWAGGIDVPINPELRGTFLRHVLADSGADVLIVDSTWADRVVALGLPTLKHVVIVGTPPDVSLPMTTHAFDDLLSSSPGPMARRDERDVAHLLYTSGTTGPSKGVVHSHLSCGWLTQGYLDNLHLTSDDCGYSMFPLHHVMGRGAMVTTAFWAGCRVVLRPRFTATGFWDDIRESGATYFGYFGAVLLFLSRQEPSPDDTDHRVRVAFGASAPPEILGEWRRRFGFDLVEVYGSTELGLASCSPLDQAKPGTMGRPVPYLELAVHDEQGRVVPPGTVGEIVARPRQPGAMMSGYWGRPQETLDAIRDLWFRSGDAGSIDEDGYLTFKDRIKDSIRRRGENISSFEVEEAVRSLPTIADCAAYPVPSEHSDDEVMVAVVVDGDLDHEEFFRRLIESMPRFAVPRYVRIVADLPRTPTQKIQKFLLREEGITQDTIDREALGIHPPRA